MHTHAHSYPRLLHCLCVIDPINLVMFLACMNNTALEISGRSGEGGGGGGGHVHSLSSVTALEWLVHDAYACSCLHPCVILRKPGILFQWLVLCICGVPTNYSITYIAT